MPPPTLQYGDRFTYFSRDPARNPMLHSWTHVLVRYCDGGSYSGDVPEAELLYVTGWLRSRRLYFRGKAVLQVRTAAWPARGGKPGPN